jgi:hypothetical protein
MLTLCRLLQHAPPRSLGASGFSQGTHCPLRLTCSWSMTTTSCMQAWLSSSSSHDEGARKESALRGKATVERILRLAQQVGRSRVRRGEWVGRVGGVGGRTSIHQAGIALGSGHCNMQLPG